MSSFARNAFRLTSGSVAAQAISAIASPVLARLYAPEAFGAAGIFVSVTGLAGALACLRYDLAVVLPPSHARAVPLLIGALAAAVLVSALMLAGVAIARRYPGIDAWVWWIPPAVLATAASSAISRWHSRHERYGTIGLGRIAGAVSSAAAKLALGFGGLATGGMLIVGQVVGHVANLALLGGSLWRGDRSLIRGSHAPGAVRAALVEHRRFPQFALLSGLLLEGSLRLPVFIIAGFFAPAVVGMFAFTHATLQLPVGLISGSLAQVFMQRAASLPRDELRPRVARFFDALLSLSIVPFGLLFLFAGDLFPLIFGSDWAPAGVYARILALALVAEASTAPINNLYNVLDRQAEALWFNSMLLVVRATTLIAGGISGDVVLLLELFVAGDVAARAVKMLYIASVAGAPPAAIGRATLRSLALAAPFIAIAWAVDSLFALRPGAQLALCAVVGIAYAGCLSIRIPELRKAQRR